MFSYRTKYRIKVIIMFLFIYFLQKLFSDQITKYRWELFLHCNFLFHKTMIAISRLYISYLLIIHMIFSLKINHVHINWVFQIISNYMYICYIMVIFLHVNERTSLWNFLFLISNGAFLCFANLKKKIPLVLKSYLS